MSMYDSQGRTIHPVTRRDIPLVETDPSATWFGIDSHAVPVVRGGQGRSDLEVERGATLFAIVCIALTGLCIAAMLIGGGA